MLRAEPRLAPVRYQLALAQLQAGSPQQAKTELKEAVTSAAKLPGDPQIHYHLGMVSAQLSDQEAARQALSIAAAATTPFPGQDKARKALAALR